MANKLADSGVKGTLMNDAELDAMLAEIGGPCNFENMLRCFDNKMSGMCNDPDEMIINGILCHDEEGMYSINGERAFSIEGIWVKWNYSQRYGPIGPKLLVCHHQDIRENAYLWNQPDLSRLKNSCCRNMSERNSVTRAKLIAHLWPYTTLAAPFNYILKS